MQSKMLESKLMETMKQKAAELSEFDFGNASWIDLRYLEESTRQLFLVRVGYSRVRDINKLIQRPSQCRDILKWTYVFAFFMFDKDEQTPAILKPFKCVRLSSSYFLKALTFCIGHSAVPVT